MDQLRITASDLGRDSENITLERVVSSTSDGAATQGKFNKLLQQHTAPIYASFRSRPYTALHETGWFAGPHR